MSTVYAIGNKAIVKEIEEESNKGLIIVSAQESMQVTAKVLNAGYDCKNLKSDHVIIFKRYAGTEIEHDGETFFVIEEKDVLAIIIG